MDDIWAIFFKLDYINVYWEESNFLFINTIYIFIWAYTWKFVQIITVYLRCHLNTQ